MSDSVCWHIIHAGAGLFYSYVYVWPSEACVHLCTCYWWEYLHGRVRVANCLRVRANYTHWGIMFMTVYVKLVIFWKFEYSCPPVYELILTRIFAQDWQEVTCILREDTSTRLWHVDTRWHIHRACFSAGNALRYITSQRCALVNSQTTGVHHLDGGVAYLVCWRLQEDMTVSNIDSSPQLLQPWCQWSVAEFRHSWVLTPTYPGL